MNNLDWDAVALSLIKIPVRLAQILHSHVLSYWLRHYASQPLCISDRPAIIISPHQDDETLGCGGLIALKRQLGSQVAIVFLTDGSASPTIDPDCQDLINLRRQEAIAALSVLGVSTSDIHFLNYPDGNLQEMAESERQSLVTQLSVILEQYQAQEVYVPHCKDGHRDHEAAFQITQAATVNLPRAIELFQYPIWLFWKRPFLLKLKQQDLMNVHQVDILPVKAKKRTAIQAYRSQLPFLPFGFLNLYLGSTELFFAHPTQPIHSTEQPQAAALLHKSPD